DGEARAVEPTPEALAAAFDELLGDDEGRRLLGEAGRARVLTHHRREAMARSYEALYDELLER
ncbi:MAG: glycogen synthase, partial [Deltaproteobacteria bacterium]|nr:glycogen synthase [Deltaproteobacteria bacterium]